MKIGTNDCTASYLHCGRYCQGKPVSPCRNVCVYCHYFLNCIVSFLRLNFSPPRSFHHSNPIWPRICPSHRYGPHEFTDCTSDSDDPGFEESDFHATLSKLEILVIIFMQEGVTLYICYVYFIYRLHMYCIFSHT